MPCTELTICVDQLPDAEWLRDFFTRLLSSTTSSIVSLTLKLRIESSNHFWSVSDEVFSLICNWVRIKAEALRKLTITNIQYEGSQLMFLRAALTERFAQLEEVEVLNQNKFQTEGKK